MRELAVFCTIAMFVTVAPSALAQRPIIAPGGIVNAATYAARGSPGHPLAPGSIGTIFGQNLARQTTRAVSTPLPIRLAGTSVSINGKLVPLFFVSPSQINFQVPSSLVSIGDRRIFEFPVIVTTESGASDAVAMQATGYGTGIFTLDGSGCGQGAVLNAHRDGRVTINGPENSVAPGEFITVFGTGMGATLSAIIPDGEPAPVNPPARISGAFSGIVGDLSAPVNVFKAPGLIGVDQTNLRVPESSLEGCTIPLQLSPWSQLVPVAIRRGGETCQDVRNRSAILRWERVVTSDSAGLRSQEQLAVELQEAIWKRPPAAPPPFPGPGGCRCEIKEIPAYLKCMGFENYYSYRALNAGPMVIQGPTFEQRISPQLVDGQPVYSTNFPTGTLREGTFRLRAEGGHDVGPFEDSSALPIPIEVTSRFPPGTVIPVDGSVTTIAWTGGRPDQRVRITLISTSGLLNRTCECGAVASSGKFDYRSVFYLVGGNAVDWLLLSNADLEIQVSIEALGDEVHSFQADGLSFSGQAGWRHIWKFTGLRTGPAPR